MYVIIRFIFPCFFIFFYSLHTLAQNQEVSRCISHYSDSGNLSIPLINIADQPYQAGFRYAPESQTFRLETLEKLTDVSWCERTPVYLLSAARLYLPVVAVNNTDYQAELRLLPEHNEIRFALVSAQLAPPRDIDVAYTYQVVNTYPHDSEAFTQGLFFHSGHLYESIGLRGHSALRELGLESTLPVREHQLASTLFAEGLTLYQDNLYQLTWTSGIGFVYALEDFKPIADFYYPTQGWGLTNDDYSLIYSDGSAVLRFMDPADFSLRREISVHDDNGPVYRLNELEYVAGEIYANIWMSNRIARISPTTGRVLAWIDLTGLLPAEQVQQADVLNGIAYDSSQQRLLVTGKLWPTLFEIELLQSKK
ncbi:glutaminyl-peptide cyclotransferase [Candidatus Venteria ishoeyi]|uniref:glutaminyl-peptide cyclotransferase n=1 Tax=Candidatus Venteria ishoeyi TaxID=1899563 RepID=UPI0025A65380|nr:glutaminyl-peptide cyclotransferase [Candidatus Venteria ishoeyi]MDM8546336.1 glutaminyl-peptide cyclotransferase [Candidatus Venteria ishoeyi]